LVEKLWAKACESWAQLIFLQLRQIAVFYAAAQIEGKEVKLESPPKALVDEISAAASKSEVTVSRGHQVSERSERALRKTKNIYEPASGASSKRSEAKRSEAKLSEAKRSEAKRATHN